jgi:hypothetical protein
MSFICTNRTGRKTHSARWGRALAGLSLLVLGLHAHAQVTVQTIGGGPRANSCASPAGFAEGNTYTNAQFNDPYASALDSQTNLWVADTDNSDVEEISQAGNRTASITTHLVIVMAITNKSGKVTSYETNSHPFPKVNGIAVDSADNLYIMMPTNGLLVKYDQFLNPLSEIFFTNGSTKPMASALMVDGSSNVFMAFTNGMIVRFQLVDGYPAPVYSNNLVSGGQLPVHYIVSSFHWNPVALALRADGQLAVSDTLSNAIYLVATNDDSVPTLLAGGNGAGWRDGTPQFAEFDQPHGIAASADGRMVVCDTLNNRVRIIDTLTNTKTLYGTASNVWTATLCDDIPALFAGWVDGAAGTTTTSASGREPVSVTISPTGTLFVTEQFYDLIRSVTGSGLTPVNAVGVPLGLGPLVTTLFASNITATGATLNAAVNPQGEPAAAFFQWGLTSSNGNITISTNLTVNLNITNTVSLPLTNLQPGTTYFYQGVAVNSTGTGTGSELVFTTLSSQQPTISFSPNSGYFPECVTISITSSVPTVYFTIDGSTPTTNSDSVTLATNSGDFVGTLQWCNPQIDLTSLRIAAFNSTISSTIIAGGSPSTNLVGFPTSTQSGAGDIAYIPVVVDLQNNGTLKSLQFRVEVTPNDTNTTPMISSLTLQAITANDFVQLAGPAPGNAPVSLTNFPPYITSSNGMGLLVSASGTTSGVDIQGFGVAVLLRVEIPKNAPYGQSYSLNVLYPSGTSDGIDDEVGLAAMPAQTLTITDPLQLAGDSAPPSGYNNGEFGNEEINDGDANAVLYAMVNIRRPYSDSDAYKAMDVYPETGSGTSGIIGDGFLTYLDWQTVVYRSVGLDTNTWIRCWTNGALFHVETPAVPPNTPVKLDSTPTPPGLVWFCQFSVGAGTVSYGLPGNTCSLPVYAKVLPGYDVSGMAFRVMAVPDGGAPAVGQIQFNPASDIPAPQISPGLSANDIVCSWSIGGFNPPLQGSNYLGTISFEIPPTAQPGASYTLQFVVAGGAPDLTTEYQMESFPGTVWVGTAAQQPPSLTSDEWKTYFFGSTANPLAADNVDADGDGMPNWMEYLAGTNPTNASSCFQFTSATFNTNGLQGVAVNWLTAPGKTYILESQPDLGGKNWTAINTNSGDGNYYQLLITNYSGNSRFYQILLQP